MNYRGEMSMWLRRESSEFSGPFCQVCGYNKNKNLLGITNIVSRFMVWKVPIIEEDLNLEVWDNLIALNMYLIYKIGILIAIDSNTL